ncbi:hypothetical protein MMC26_002605 [Xylographa opegraphella]|nr:hypothetical protein [Xylographa opegraphella]
MQSRPIEVPNTSSSVDFSEDHQQRQHGFIRHDEPSSYPTSFGTEGGGRQDSQSAAPAAVRSTENPVNLVETPTRGLSPEASPKTRLAPDRITQYERATTPQSKSKSRGPDFKVVSRPRKSSSSATLLAEFPNEVLTHILSHLPPPSLSAVACVSRRFHALVTTPHAWRIAFSRYFPGSDSLEISDAGTDVSSEAQEIFSSDKRVFTRLTAFASWRSEYILRTRLLRSLARGKPAIFEGLGTPGSSRSGPGHSGNAQITYNSLLFTTVNHLHASFGTGLNKRLPRFIHGADETGSASSSDPNNGKVDKWGSLDPQSFVQFVDRFPGDTQYGLGAGDIVGLPNSMDVSQPYGMAYAEGFPGGSIYFRSTEEQRGTALASSRLYSMPEYGIPRLDPAKEAMCCIWIAKNPNVPTISEGLIGIISGSSSGVVTAYSLGTTNVGGRRIERGEITARWMLSPGVPIIAIVVDENFSVKRLSQNRLWAVALNALGEVFYLTQLPSRRFIDRAAKLDPQRLDELAWETGRTISWSMIELTRREARVDPFESSVTDGSYSPRSSWDAMGLDKAQIVAETKEIESFVKEKPKHFRRICDGWDMRRRLVIDFAGDCGNAAGEATLVCCCGLNDQPVKFQRFTRCQVVESQDTKPILEASYSQFPNIVGENSVFGGPSLQASKTSDWSFETLPTTRTSSAYGSDHGITSPCLEEWRMSEFSFGDLKATQVTTMAIDESNYNSLTALEDPLLTLSGSSNASSPLSSPWGQAVPVGSRNDIPGQRARFVAAGTKFGTVLLWNIRAPISGSTEIMNTVHPVRIIHTDSPQISCLAMSALYLVHGGNDGLVQAWDPLASTTQPIRTLNSRFSSRARRRLVQAEASAQGVGINLFAAGTICLDPDPTVLRGMVSLGTHLRYWSYSSSAADQYKSTKRRSRRSERGSNQGGEKFSQTGRGALQDYIANERADLEREKEVRRKEEERLAGRFGLGLLGPGAGDDEIMAYATLLSEEAARADETRRKSESESSDGLGTSTTITEVFSSPLTSNEADDERTEADIAEAIRLSLEESADSELVMDRALVMDFPVKYAKKKKSPSTSPTRAAASSAGGSRQAEEADLDFAMQLSLAEEQSRRELEEDFPALSKTPSPPNNTKGKGKRRAS